MNINFDNTKATKERAKHITIPTPKAGNGKLHFNVGDKVVSSPIGAYKSHIEGIIETAETVNGHARYGVRWSFPDSKHKTGFLSVRDGDIVLAGEEVPYEKTMECLKLREQEQEEKARLARIFAI